MMARGVFAAAVIFTGALASMAEEPTKRGRVTSTRQVAAARTSGNVILVMQQAPADTPPQAAASATPSGPIMISDGPPGTAPVVNCSDPASCSGDSGSCKSGFLTKICPKLNRPKTPVDPLVCGTFCSHWRFALGSCRAFFEDGRYEPKYPGNCPCGK
jgi:hypothetical protein